MNPEIKTTKKTPKSLKALKKQLPYHAVSMIHKKLKGKVSKRLIQLVLNDKVQDHHRIIPIALKIAASEQAKRSKLKSAYKVIFESAA